MNVGSTFPKGCILGWLNQFGLQSFEAHTASVQKMRKAKSESVLLSKIEARTCVRIGHMPQLFRILMVLSVAVLGGTAARAQDSDDLDPVARAHATGNLGPATIKLGDIATIDLPKGYMFVPAYKNAMIGSKLEAAVNHKVLGAILPSNTATNWYATVSILETGYLTSAKVDSLDKSDVLATMRAVVLKNNPARMMAGFTKVDMGNRWLEEPRHDAARGRFTTSVRMFETGPSTHDDDFANIDTFLFGRNQVIRVGLRAMLTEHKTYRPQLELLTNAIQFQPGLRAQDVIAGTDKPAEHVMDVIFGGRTLVEIASEAAEEAEAAKRRAAMPQPMDRATQMKLLLGGLLGVVALIALIYAFRGGRSGSISADAADRSSRVAQRR